MDLNSLNFGELNGFTIENFSSSLGSIANVTPKLIKKRKKKK